MSLLGKIFGVGEAKGTVEAVGGLLDNLFTSDEERLDKQTVLQRLALEPAMVQAEINKIEAGSRSVFVAGWRPFIGWICGIALFLHFIFTPLLTFFFAISGIDVPETAIQFDYGHLQTILFGMLGLGGLRTAEKVMGYAK